MINKKMRMLGAKRSVIRELFEYGRKRKSEIGEDAVFDFSLGNPSVAAPEVVNAEMKRLLEEESSILLHGYTSAPGDLGVRKAISDYVNNTHGESTTPDCFYMTVGAAAALTSTLTALCMPGEEVIVPTPYFPEYKVFIERCGAIVREVECDARFMLDVEKISAAISDKTAAIIVNSPNNPTGAVFDEENIIALTSMLKKKEAELKKPIYIIADEPYRELVYDGAVVPFLTRYYDDTVVCYSYSKSLSIPGERIGYVLVCPRISDFASVYQAVAGAARALGFVCAPSLLQKIIPACLGSVADVSIYDRNRRLLIEKLSSLGFETVKPDGAFYLFIKSPSGDASEFSERAKAHEILIVPSDDFGCPGYARLAYCVRTEQIEAALPAFEALAADYKKDGIL